jgi:hypothetical protein
MLSENFSYAYAKIENYILTAGATLALGGIMFSFVDVATIQGNYGSMYVVVEVFLQVVIALLFGINTNVLFMKIRMASLSKRATGSTAVGAFLSVLVSGCPACSITLASYLGLAGVLGAFAYSGFFLKLAGIALLVYSIHYSLKHLTVCQHS